MEYELGNNVIITPDEGDEYPAIITGIIQDEKTGERKYYVNSQIELIESNHIRLLTMSFDVFVDLDSATAEFQVIPIHNDNRYLKGEAKHIEEFYIVSTKPEIVIYIYWNIKPGTIPRRYVNDYLKALYTSAAMVSERSN